MTHGPIDHAEARALALQSIADLEGFDEPVKDSETGNIKLDPAGRSVWKWNPVGEGFALYKLARAYLELSEEKVL